MILIGKSPQEYPADACILRDCILGPLLFLLHINNPPDDVICNIAIYSSNTTRYPMDSVF